MTILTSGSYNTNDLDNEGKFVQKIGKLNHILPDDSDRISIKDTIVLRDGYSRIQGKYPPIEIPQELNYYRLKAIGLAPTASRLKITRKSDPNNK